MTEHVKGELDRGKPELLPCPFCGETEILHTRGEDKVPREWLTCINCECEGPYCYGGETPQERWNLRSRSYDDSDVKALAQEVMDSAKIYGMMDDMDECRRLRQLVARVLEEK